MTILEAINNRPRTAEFRPASAEDLIALRLAQKLGEPETAAHFAKLVLEYSADQISAAYRRAINGGGRAEARRFHQELELVGHQRSKRPDEPLMAIKIERRAIAVAVFVDSRLDYHDTRTLLANESKAEASAAGFINWVLDSYEVHSVAMERLTDGNEIRRVVLSRAVQSLLRGDGIPIWEVSKADLLAGFGHPPLKTRDMLRQAAQKILWAMLNTERPEPHELDAAALGLFVQTERLFLY